MTAAGRTRVAVGAAIVVAGRLLAGERTGPAALAGLWEFPGGKVEPDEDELAALVRECREELGVTVRPVRRVGPEVATAAPGTVLRVWLCELVAGTPTALEHAALRWLGAEELGDVPWIPADLPVVAAVRPLLEGAVGAGGRTVGHMEPSRRILFVHAHPDDETINNGATMARYAAEGAGVTLVTCTLGEEGEVLVPDLVHLAADAEDRLGTHRQQELAAACAALGVTDHRILGGPGRYRDSGMMGTPANERPDCFWRADQREAAELLVAVLREVRPQVVVTYDDFGGYGHPDHIQAHRVTMAAVALGADRAARPDLGEPWAVSKVYWNAVPRSELQRHIDALAAAGQDFFGGVASADDVPFAVADVLVAAAVDGAAHVPAKLAAMRAHATQIAADGPFLALTGSLGEQVWGTEHYRLALGLRGTGDPAAREADLFAGVA